MIFKKIYYQLINKEWWYIFNIVNSTLAKAMGTWEFTKAKNVYFPLKNKRFYLSKNYAVDIGYEDIPTQTK